MTLHTALGNVILSSNVFTSITGHVATNCFGVKGMAVRNVSDGLVQLVRRENLSRGVKITVRESKAVSIELHIVVEHGVNIPAVCDSITSEVRYHVERLTGAAVDEVNVFVDGMMAD